MGNSNSREVVSMNQSASVSEMTTRKGRTTRNTQYLAIAFSVNQGHEPTCAYVTLAKVLVNIIAALVDIELNDEEKKRLNIILYGFPIRTDVAAMERELSIYGFPPKEFTLIALFFYFFDWLKKNDFRPYYVDSVTPIETVTRDKPETPVMFEKKLGRLFDYLKLTTTRLGGVTFTASGWIFKVTEQLQSTVGMLKWKKTAVRTINSRYGSSSATFNSAHFHRLCFEIIFPIMNKGITIYLTLINGTRFHDVMLAGIDFGNLLISNSWRNPIDSVPITDLPRITLKTDDGGAVVWEVFQFNFYLPMKEEEHRLDPLKQIYDLDSYEEFNVLMMDYLKTDLDLPPLDFGMMTLQGRDKVGGKRRNKSKRRNKKTFLEYESVGRRKRLDC